MYQTGIICSMCNDLFCTMENIAVDFTLKQCYSDKEAMNTSNGNTTEHTLTNNTSDVDDNPGTGTNRTDAHLSDDESHVHSTQEHESDDDSFSRRNGKNTKGFYQKVSNGLSPEPLDPIDLVLNEIGQKETTEGKDQKKLTFDLGDDETLVRKDATATTSSDPVYRYKVIDTIWLFWNVTTMGWAYGQMGPALPDLQILAGVPLQQATWLFTGSAIGYLGGCLLAGIIQDKFNPRLMLFLYTFGTAVTIGLLPWIPVFVVMVIIRVLNGICIGGQDTGIHSMLFALWAKDGGPFIQMTHVLSALGGIISPLVTQQFVSKTGDTDQVASPTLNGSLNDTPTHSTTNTTIATLTPAVNKATNVQYAFLITGILMASAALPFLVAFLSKRRITKTTRQYSNDSTDKKTLPPKVKYLILGIILTNSFIATANIDLFPSFLTTFVLEQLGWTQKSASTLTSVYFATYGVGNFVGVFALKCLTTTKLIAFSYTTSIITIIGVLVSVIYEKPEAIWVTVAISGITLSSILPMLFTWTQQNVTPITGRIASILLISGSAGVMVNPLLLGYMMDLYTPMWFLYLSLGEIVLCAMLFTIALSLSRIFSSAGQPQSESEQPATPDEIAVAALREEILADAKTKTEIYSRVTLYGV